LIIHYYKINTYYYNLLPLILRVLAVAVCVELNPNGYWAPQIADTAFSFISGGVEATVDTVESIRAFQIPMTYFDEDGINVDGDHTKDVMRNHGGGEYVKLRWDPQSETSTTTDRRGSCLWYWVKSGLCFLCLGLVALVAIKWVGPLFIKKV